jgi:hypothetical protein
MNKKEKKLSELPDFNDQEAIDEAIDYMIKESIENTKKEFPHLQEHVQKIQNSRGAGLESAIMSEQVIKHILSYMGYDKDKVLSFTYGQKIDEIIKILEKNLEKDEWRDETIKNLRRINRLRNIYAHVPGDYESGILRFDPSENYYRKGEEEFRSKSLEEMNEIFKDLEKDIMKRTMEILKKLAPIREKEKNKV